jgi:hypothetical protein
VQPYPLSLRQVTLERFGWECTFALETARKAAERGDVAYVAGCCFRCVACLMQVLFARNGEYLLNEKGAVALAATFPICPSDLVGRVATAFGYLSESPAALIAAIVTLAGLVEDALDS